ncbi:hypothetical protein [Novipirellula rosea]|uniref:Uncharacterized protein n=1 Tax=Novipirellula rosea TaxID=1031540 RepID=A0ABP8NB15_9BACT
MNPKLVLTIAGVGCVGKGSLIDRLQTIDHGMREHFGVIGKPNFFASRERTRSGLTAYRPRHEMFRPEYPDTIVFRWQEKDHNLIQMLYQAHPNANHRVIVLWRDPTTHQSDIERVHNTKRKVKDVWESYKKRFRPDRDHWKWQWPEGLIAELYDSTDYTYRPMKWHEV